ncbi:MAG: hypothetical protein V4757_06615 [Pseudomonadota bacterium]
MLQFKPDALLRALSGLSSISGNLHFVEAMPVADQEMDFGKLFPTMRPSYVKLLAAANELDAPMTAIAVERALKMHDSGAVRVRHYREMLFNIQSRLSDEVGAKFMLVLDARDASLFAPKLPHFGEMIRAKFPRAVYDIDEAAKCLSLGRSTAAVFHLMRAVEIVLKAISANLALAPQNNPNWGQWLDSIRKGIESRSPIGAKKWSEHAFFQDVYQQLTAIKDAQRNPTLHTETIHTDAEAHLIFRNSESLMQKIAARMDEKGLPLA